jgi:hypothetical protein
LDDGYGVKNERLYDYENVYEITDWTHHDDSATLFLQELKEERQKRK